MGGATHFLLRVALCDHFFDHAGAQHLSVQALQKVVINLFQCQNVFPR